MNIYKYAIPKAINEGGELEIDLPRGAVILAIAATPELGGFLGPLETWTPYIWALVDPDAEEERRHFLINATGLELPDGIIKVRGQVIPNGYLEDGRVLEYVATFQQGPYVWHVFERTWK